MLIALVYTMILAVIVTAMAYLISTEIRSVGFQLDDTKALYLAQAGVERAVREIRDETITPPQTGTADLRGADTTLSLTVTNPLNMRYIDATTYTAATCATIPAGSTTSQAIIRSFDSNYTQTKIQSVVFFVRASRATGGNGATIAASYTTNGSTYTTAFTQLLPNSTTLVNYSKDITGTLTWAQLMSPNFRLRVMYTVTVPAGNRAAYIDAIWLRVTYAIDTNTEPWYTGTYTAFPVTLGDGFIQSVSIVDEARKVHLNYASQDLLRYLMQGLGVNTGTANTLATDIVAYRSTKFFDSVEELKQLSRMTQDIYDLIKDYVTVYSFVNINSYRPAASRAPVNINTTRVDIIDPGTPQEKRTSFVLEAIFRTVLTAALSRDLAVDIVALREGEPPYGPTPLPFTCFYSSDPAVTTDFYDFVNSRSYLNASRRNQILYIADASLLIPVSGYNPASPPQKTTEFCYASTTYKIESVGKILAPAYPPVLNKIDRNVFKSDINLRVQTVIGNDGSRTLPTYVGDTVLTGYWKESYVEWVTDPDGSNGRWEEKEE